MSGEKDRGDGIGPGWTTDKHFKEGALSVNLPLKPSACDYADDNLI